MLVQQLSRAHNLYRDQLDSVKSSFLSEISTLSISRKPYDEDIRFKEAMSTSQPDALPSGAASISQATDASSISSGTSPSKLEKQANETWKTHGYPELTRWMASSNDFLVLRRFGQTGTRIALKLQDELVRMEDELRQMDAFASSQPRGCGGSGSYRLDEDSPRDRLLLDMAPKLKEYCTSSRERYRLGCPTDTFQMTSSILSRK